MEAVNEFLYRHISSPISLARVCPDTTVSLGRDSSAPGNIAVAKVPSPHPGKLCPRHCVTERYEMVMNCTVLHAAAGGK